MVQQIAAAGEYLEKIDYGTIDQEDFAPLLHFTASTLQTIFKIGQEKYNENK